MKEASRSPHLSPSLPLPEDLRAAEMHSSQNMKPPISIKTTTSRSDFRHDRQRISGRGGALLRFLEFTRKLDTLSSHLEWSPKAIV